MNPPARKQAQQFPVDDRKLPGKVWLWREFNSDGQAGAWHVSLTEVDPHDYRAVMVAFTEPHPYDLPIPYKVTAKAKRYLAQMRAKGAS